MALFYLHLHECGGVTLDEDGADFDTPEQARQAAIRAAREMMCAEVTEGKLCLEGHIHVEDVERGSSFDVQFRDTVVISG